MKTVTIELLWGMPLPKLLPNSDKDERGRALVVAGSAEVPGAAILTATAALRAGAGKLQIAATDAFAMHLAIAMPEARVITAGKGAELDRRAANAIGPLLEHCDALIIGPGMMGDGAADLLADLASAHGEAAFLADAAALTGLSERPGCLDGLAGRLVLTPHAGEMASLLGVEKAAVLADPQRFAVTAARQWSATVALKGQRTVIASPDGACWHHLGGARGLGTSGSGDVLAGIIGGLLARGAPPVTATLWGVYLHGAAGRVLSDQLGPLGFLAREIPGVIPMLLAGLSPHDADETEMPGEDGTQH